MPHYANVAFGAPRAAKHDTCDKMNAEWTPMRWPGSWKSPSALGLLKGTPINYLLVDKDAALAPCHRTGPTRRTASRRNRFASPGVAFLPGEWPGVAMARGGGGICRPHRRPVGGFQFLENPSGGRSTSGRQYMGRCTSQSSPRVRDLLPDGNRGCRCTRWPMGDLARCPAHDRHRGQQAGCPGDLEGNCRCRRLLLHA